ncbi:MAG TPA: hypothetical protein VMR81_02030 [Patescibacteria group bacterium]|jgi:hypothetical protein|nr:hypothetical protein [Patescibacteria group bacterium]
MDQIVGHVTNPLPGPYQSLTGANGGLILFFTNILRLVFVIAGIYAFINFIIAGFQYMSAAGDSKALSAALDRIWYSLLGIIIVIGSFALAALVGQIVFGSATFILSPTIYGPGQ